MIETGYDSLGWYWKHPIDLKWYGPFPTEQLALLDAKDTMNELGLS